MEGSGGIWVCRDLERGERGLLSWAPASAKGQWGCSSLGPGSPCGGRGLAF